jgi:hypothetical protein
MNKNIQYLAIWTWGNYLLLSILACITTASGKANWGDNEFQDILFLSIIASVVLQHRLFSSTLIQAAKLDNEKSI